MLWLLLGLMTAVFYSLINITARYVLKDENMHALAYAPVQSSFSLFFIGLAVFLLGKTSVPTEFWVAGALIAPFIYLASVLWGLAAHTTEASVISPLLQTNVLFLLLIGTFFLSQPISVKNVIGIFLIFLGGFLIISKGFKIPKLSTGILLALLSAFMDSISKTIMDMTVEGKAITLTLTILFYRFVIAWILAFFYKKKELKKFLNILPKKKNYFYAIVARSFFSFAATFSFVWALQLGLLAKVGAASNTAPLFSVVFGFLLLKESDIKKKFFGSLIIVAGLFLLA